MYQSRDLQMCKAAWFQVQCWHSQTRLLGSAGIPACDFFWLKYLKTGLAINLVGRVNRYDSLQLTVSPVTLCEPSNLIQAGKTGQKVKFCTNVSIIFGHKGHHLSPNSRSLGYTNTTGYKNGFNLWDDLIHKMGEACISISRLWTVGIQKHTFCQ